MTDDEVKEIQRHNQTKATVRLFFNANYQHQHGCISSITITLHAQHFLPINLCVLVMSMSARWNILQTTTSLKQNSDLSDKFLFPDLYVTFCNQTFGLVFVTLLNKLQGTVVGFTLTILTYYNAP